MAKKKIPELPLLNRDAAEGDLVAGWDAQTNKTVAIDVTKLPGNGGGGGGGDAIPVTTVPSPFMITNGDESYTYDAENGISKITDARLLNKENYPVSTDQFGGGDFHLSQITYNAVDPDDDTKGSVLISAFQLDDGAHVTLMPSGEISSDSNAEFAQMKSDVTLMKLVLAPLMTTELGVNGAKLWWIRPVSEIPAGWQICEDMQGLMPIAQDPDDAYNAATNPDGLDRAIGTPGGGKSHTISIEEIPPHMHGMDKENVAGGVSGIAGDAWGQGNGGHYPDGTGTGSAGGYDPGDGNKVAKPFSIMNPYIIGVWIEFVGI